MKVFAALIAGASLLTASQAYVVTLYSGKDCTGTSTSRNVWDNTCAYTKGFQSFELTKYGGGTQQLIAYSRQACAGPLTATVCASGINGIPLGECYAARNGDGGSNALSSYSTGAECPN